MNDMTRSLTHAISTTDQMMLESIEHNQFKLVEFNHRAHVKLAYCYLARTGLTRSVEKMQGTLKAFLFANGVDKNKFHVTLTQAWLKAVWHFMQHCPEVMSSADEFVQRNPVLLNKDLLLSHYSHDLLFSDKARKKYVHPDLNPFPEHS